jgi:hypothetical protein
VFHATGQLHMVWSGTGVARYTDGRTQTVSVSNTHAEVTGGGEVHEANTPSSGYCDEINPPQGWQDERLTTQYSTPDPDKYAATDTTTQLFILEPLSTADGSIRMKFPIRSDLPNGNNFGDPRKSTFNTDSVLQLTFLRRSRATN